MPCHWRLFLRLHLKRKAQEFSAPRHSILCPQLVRFCYCFTHKCQRLTCRLTPRDNAREEGGSGRRRLILWRKSIAVRHRFTIVRVRTCNSRSRFRGPTVWLHLYMKPLWLLILLLLVSFFIFASLPLRLTHVCVCVHEA